MRKLLCCALAICWLNSEVLAQLRSSSVNTLTTKLIDEKGQLVASETYQGLQANSFNIPQFIEDHVDQYRVKISGLFKTDQEVDYIKFDSKQLGEIDADGFCEVNESSIKPLLGIVVTGCENLYGVEITRIAANTNATQADLQIGDVVVSLNGEMINSYCDLKMLVNETSVGDEVSLSVLRNGKESIKKVVVGAQIKNQVSYTSCDKSAQELLVQQDGEQALEATLNSFPNPTKGISFIQFASDLEAPITLYVMNEAGAIIEKQTYPFFAESLRSSYDFDGLPSGVYYIMVEQEDQVYKTKVLVFEH